jgi:hypothetical protein
MLQMHSLMSFMEYLLVWVWALRAKKSCTSQMPLFFLATVQIRQLKGLFVGWMTPNFNHLVVCTPPDGDCLVSRTA